jgi:hypothetical protein
MRNLSAAFLLACCAFLGGCAGHGKPVVPSYNGGDVGCQVVAGEVVFRFNPSSYANVTRNDNGEWLKIGDVTIKSVSVAGEFNDWSKDAWQMTEVKDGVYELRKDLGGFGGRHEWQFKFVVNGFYWVEPPTDAPNRIPSGAWGANRSYNLVLTVP